MYQFILFIHVFAAICIIALVLVQQGKGATMGAAFGSGASQTVFGSRGSGSFLFRITIGLLILFFITSIGLNYLVMRVYKHQNVMALPGLPHIPLKPQTKTNPTTTPVQQNIPVEQGKNNQMPTSVTPEEMPIRK